MGRLVNAEKYRCHRYIAEGLKEMYQKVPILYSPELSDLLEKIGHFFLPKSKLREMIKTGQSVEEEKTGSLPEKCSYLLPYLRLIARGQDLKVRQKGTRLENGVISFLVELVTEDNVRANGRILYPRLLCHVRHRALGEGITG